MDLKVAKAIAVEKCYLLQPYCEIIKIAGGIRRKKPDPHDIELVVRPKKDVVTDLFGKETEIRSRDFIKVVNRLGEITVGKATEKMMRIVLPEKILLDLFIPDDFDYYRIFAIRTGSREYAQKVIANGWVRKGFVGTSEGLRKKEDCKNIGSLEKPVWKCINANPYIPPTWESEESFFDFIGVKFIEPSKRV